MRERAVLDGAVVCSVVARRNCSARELCVPRCTLGKRNGELALAGVISDFHHLLTPPGEVRFDARVVNKPDRPHEHTEEEVEEEAMAEEADEGEVPARVGENGRKGRRWSGETIGEHTEPFHRFLFSRILLFSCGLPPPPSPSSSPPPLPPSCRAKAILIAWRAVTLVIG